MSGALRGILLTLGGLAVVWALLGALMMAGAFGTCPMCGQMGPGMMMGRGMGGMMGGMMSGQSAGSGHMSGDTAAAGHHGMAVPGRDSAQDSTGTPSRDAEGSHPAGAASSGSMPMGGMMSGGRMMSGGMMMAMMAMMAINWIVMLGLIGILMYLVIQSGRGRRGGATRTT